MELKKFSERLKELRTEKRLTQMELSKETGISQASIGKWELQQRVPTLLNIVTLCKYFKVSSDYLIGLKD